MEVMHWLLIGLGWAVLVCGGIRGYALLKHGLWVRALMVFSWVLLAAAVSLLALLYNGPRGGIALRALFVVALAIGSAGLLARHFTHDDG